MPAPFSPDKREQIRQKLIEVAETELPVVGLKGMSIDRLAASAGISKGAFYSFFPSKEALCLAVIAHQAPGVRARVMSHLETGAHPTPPAAFKAFLTALFEEYDHNPVLKRLISQPDEVMATRASATADDRQRKQDLGLEPLRVFFEISPETTVPAESAVNAVVLLMHVVLHKNVVGDAAWPPARAVLIDGLTSGLFFTNQGTEA